MRNYTLTKGNRRLTILAIFIVFALICATCVSIFVSMPTANAAGNPTIGEIVFSQPTENGKLFNRKLLETLFGYLTDLGTFESLEDAATTRITDYTHGKTSADFRLQNSGNNIQITFGGKKWDVVFLTTATINAKTDVILDLWLSNDSASSQKQKVSYAEHQQTTLSIYPSNMYSTSKVRVLTLNNGGRYCTGGIGLMTQNKQTSNEYARFTMTKEEGVDNSLTEYIATPAQVEYQANEWDKETVAAYYNNDDFYYFPNEAYDEPISDPDVSWWNDNGAPEYSYKYSRRDTERDSDVQYGAWKNDYLWLPSLSETGLDDTGNGIWDVDIYQRGQSSSWRSWLRSGSHDDVSRAMAINGYGVGEPTVGPYNYQTGFSYVRPALHLNLTKAYEDSEYPTSYTFELPDNVDFVDPDGTAEIEITAHDIFLPAGKTLTLYVKSTNGMADSKFCIMLEGKQVDYTVTASGDHVVNGEVYDPTNGQIVWQFAGEGQIDSETFTITLTVTSPPGAVGDWTDSLIFTAVVS